MTRRRKPDEALDIVLPVPSFLDMVFQILAFFIFTYNPASLEGQMELALPASGEARAESQDKADPTKIPDTEMDLTSPLLVTIIGDDDAKHMGDIKEMTVAFDKNEARQVYSSTEDFRRDLNENNLGKFQSFLLRTIKENLDPEEQKSLANEKERDKIFNKFSIKITAYSAVKFAFVAKVMDACAKAGFKKKIGFSPPPDYTASN